MKYNFKITTIIALLAIFGFQSCKKENNAVKPKQPENLQAEKVDPNSVLSKIKVNANGYLVFSSRNDLVAYGKLMNSSTRDLVLSSLHSKGFTKKNEFSGNLQGW